MAKNKKERVDIVYSTNPNFGYEYEDDNQEETLEPSKQNLKVMLDRKMRKGKTVTLITGFIGDDEDLKELAKILKSSCGAGGTAKDGEIIVQGDFKVKVLDKLISLGYKAKGAGGN